MSPDRAILIIANPAANGGRGRAFAGHVASELHARGVEVAVRETSRPGGAGLIAAAAVDRGASRPRCVVASGGDGTVQEVAHALATAPADRRPSMGLIPAGRCNDFARALGIPTAPAGVVATLIDGVATPVDLGRVDGRHFCTVATVGIDAEVTSYVDSMRGPLKGTAAYLFGALRVLQRYRAKRVDIRGDFGRIERPVFLASTANTRLYGGSIPIAPQASPTDGWLDLCVINEMPLSRALTLIPVVLAAKHGSRADVRFFRTKRLSIDAQEPLEVWADGERLGRTPVTMAVAAGAVDVVLPRGAPPVA